jgi:hypothetical protein
VGGGLQREREDSGDQRVFEVEHDGQVEGNGKRIVIYSRL